MEKEEEERKEIEVDVGELGIVFPFPYCGEWDYIKIDELKNKKEVSFECNCGKKFEIKLIWPEKEA